jgi:hypothetical protein
LQAVLCALIRKFNAIAHNYNKGYTWDVELPWGWDFALHARGARNALALILATCLLSAGEKPTPHPVRPAELQLLIGRADRVVVYGNGTPYSAVYSSANPKDLLELQEALAVQSPKSWFRCACYPELQVELSRKGKELGVIEIEENLTIGFSQWSGDARPANRWRLLQWFDARGIQGPRRSYDRNLAIRKADRLASRRWLSGMPSTLRPLWPNLMRDPDWYNSSVNAAIERTANALTPSLTEQYPDARQRVRALFSWFGSGAGPWSGFPVAEEVPAHLLLQYMPQDLVSALEAPALTDREMEGAARFFSGYNYPTPVRIVPPLFSGRAFGAPFRTEAKDRRLVEALPADLKKSLLEHVLKTGDPDNTRRARQALGTN